ncbi:MAG: hypothetical protein ABI462_01015 [Ignavibacteria bacterium]
MLKSSLLEIIRTFSKEELKSFEDFVRSPYFNKKENVIKLFFEIKKYAPDLKDENLEKEKVWKVLFPDAGYNYGIMKNLIFDLNKLVEQFIISLKFNKDEYKQNEYLMNALLDREINKIYKNKFNSINLKPDLKILDSGILNVSAHMDYLNAMFYLKLFYHHQFEQNYDLEKLQVNRDSSLIAGFLIKLFGAYNDIVVIHTRAEKFDPGENIVSKFLGLISPGLITIIDSIPLTSDVNSAYVMIYYQMYLALTEKTEKQYLAFKKSVFDNLSILPKVNIKAIHNCLVSAAIFSRFETLDRDREILEILDSLIEHNAITEIGNDKIALHVFNTYASICYGFADAKKLKLFADRFIDKLDADVKKNTNIHINFQLSFLNKSFDDALNYISMHDIPYIYLKPVIRYDKAMCLYETDNYEMFLNEHDSLKHFLKNNIHLPERHKKSLNFKFSIIKRLFKLRQNFDSYECIKLKKEISGNETLSSGWLAGKFEEIEKNNSHKLKVKTKF